MPRVSSLPLILLILAACGGSDGVAPDNGGTVGQPASLAIHGGNNQSADPGTEVPTAPAVVVKDAGGRGVAGVAVAFSVQAGGGAVDKATATTGSDGVASAGAWTLGPQSGPNVLEARAGTLAAVMFRAQGASTPRLLADTVVGANGDTLHLGGGTAWEGLELTIPQGSFRGPSRWTFRVDPSITPPQLPSGVLITSPALSITTDQARAERLMTLRVPVTRRPGYVNAAILHDPVRNVVELLPMFGGDANSILVGTTHLNGSLLLAPGTGSDQLSAPGTGSGLRLAADGLTGSGMYSVSIPLSVLSSVPNVAARISEIFQIAEGGSYLFPDGHGPASAILNVLAKVANPSASLGTLFKPAAVPGMHLDSASLAGLVALARRYQADGGSLTPVYNGIGSLLGPLARPVRDSLTDVNLRAMLLLSNKVPQLMLFVKRLASAPYSTTDVSFSTAIGASPAGVEYVDPTVPQIAKYLLALGGQGYASRIFQAVNDAIPTDGEAVVSLGNTFLFPLEQYVDAVRKMLSLQRQALAAEAQLPQVFVELRNAANMDWVSILNGGVARSDSAEIRVRCTQCPDAVPVSADPQLQEVIAVDPASGQVRSRSRIPGSVGFLLGPLLANLPNGGLAQILGGVMAKMAGLIAPAPRVGSGPVALALAGPPVSRMLVPLNVPVRRMDMQLDPGSQGLQQHARADFTVRNAMPGAGGTIEWKFGDATAPVTGPGGDTTGSHTYHQKGTFTVEATLLQAAQRVAKVTGTVVVRDSFTVDPVADTAQVDSVVRLTARPHGDMPASARYVWSFGDSTPPDTVLNDSLATHAYRATGTYTVTVALWDATANVRLAVATATVTVVAPAFVYVSAALGGTHTCAIAPGGAAWCWGRNNRGQLGDGTTIGSTRPVKVGGGKKFAQVAGGAEHTCALTAAGAAWCWGDRVYGELGDGSPYGPQYPPALQPVAVQGAPALASISVGNRTTCGRTAGGQLWCWGYNGYTQIGDGTSENRINAVPIAIGGSVGSIGVGTVQTCAAPTGASGQTFCWGNNGKDNLAEYLVDYSPQVWGSNLLGTGSNEKTLYDPRPVVNLGLPWNRVSVGTGFVCALDLVGAASCWGLNSYGQLGNNTTQWRSNPAPVSGGRQFTTIGAGGLHACGLTAVGEVWCWGRNSTGQLGTGTGVNSPVPVRSAIGIGRVLQLSVGSASNCALTEVGDIWCWGFNGDGGLGDGTLVTRQNPVKVVP